MSREILHLPPLPPSYFSHVGPGVGDTTSVQKMTPTAPQPLPTSDPTTHSIGVGTTTVEPQPTAAPDPPRTRKHVPQRPINSIIIIVPTNGNVEPTPAPYDPAPTQDLPKTSVDTISNTHMTGTSPSTSTHLFASPPVASLPDDPSPPLSPNVGVIVGLIVGGITSIAILGIIAMYVRRKRRRRPSRQESVFMLEDKLPPRQWVSPLQHLKLNEDQRHVPNEFETQRETETDVPHTKD